jgi:inositol transport system substrate-binding protein
MLKLTKSRLFSLLLASTVAIPLVLTGCGSKPTETQAVKQTGSSGEKKLKIGVTHYALKNEFTVLVSEAQKKKAAELGVEIEVFGADYDVNTQLGQFENMIAKKYDAIIFSPVDAQAMAVAVDKAVAAKIPVIGVNTRVDSDKLTSYAGSQDVTAGEMEMKHLAEKMGGKGNIVIIEGPIGQSAQIQRREGIHKVLAQYPDIKVLSEKTGNWSRSEGLTLMENWLQAFPGKINGVCAQNDEMALGAIKALEGAKLLDKVPVVGVDGIADGLAAVKEGKLSATAFQDAQGQGEKSVELAVKALKGETLEKNYWIPFELVTKDTIDAFMKKKGK